MGFVEFYDYYWNQMADPRTNDLPFVGSPVMIPIILFSYLYFVLKCGPQYMKDRKPYDLKTFVKFYNIFQVVSNAYMVYKLLSLGLVTKISVVCSPFDYSNNPIPLEISFVFWLTMLLKLIDLIETAIFVLRKKDRQISFLHLYHHVSTVLLAWLITKYVAVAMASFTILVNSFVHVIMYTYYYFSTMGDKAPKMLKTIKPHITKIQMVQFVLLGLYGSLVFLPSCPLPKSPMILNGLNVAVFFLLFHNFYRKSYKTQEKQKN
ncbi:very long chain fatty acid elongase 1 isoform X1 [Halictus rubicundus]|uniref:very long chain fatty acid elongase 1 isoform X1 n=1 Tax=Halictus rubicundus TaxID=77578 RepID=UPI0040352F65